MATMGYVDTTGEPEPEIKWLRDGIRIKPKKSDKRLKIEWDMKEDLNILQLNSVTVEDAGQYMIVASNPAGKTSSTAIVSVMQAANKVHMVEEVSLESTGETTEGETDTEAETTDYETATETEVDFETAEETETETEDFEEKIIIAKTQVSIEAEAEELASDTDSVVEVEVTTEETKKPEAAKPHFELTPQPMNLETGNTIKMTSKVSGIDNCTFGVKHYTFAPSC